MEHFIAHTFFTALFFHLRAFSLQILKTKPNLHDRSVTVSQEKTPHLCRLITKLSNVRIFIFSHWCNKISVIFGTKNNSGVWLSMMDRLYSSSNVGFFYKKMLELGSYVKVLKVTVMYIRRRMETICLISSSVVYET